MVQLSDSVSVIILATIAGVYFSITAACSLVICRILWWKRSSSSSNPLKHVTSKQQDSELSQMRQNKRMKDHSDLVPGGRAGKWRQFMSGQALSSETTPPMQNGLNHQNHYSQERPKLPSIEEVKESPTVRDSESHVGETPGTSSQHVGRSPNLPDFKKKRERKRKVNGRTNSTKLLLEEIDSGSNWTLTSSANDTNGGSLLDDMMSSLNMMSGQRHSTECVGSDTTTSAVPIPVPRRQSPGNARAVSQTGTASGRQTDTQTGTASGRQTDTQTGTASGRQTDSQTGTASGRQTDTQTGTASGRQTNSQTGTASGRQTDTQTGTASGRQIDTQTGTASGRQIDTQTGTALRFQSRTGPRREFVSIKSDPRSDTAGPTSPSNPSHVREPPRAPAQRRRHQLGSSSTHSLPRHASSSTVHTPSLYKQLSTGSDTLPRAGATENRPKLRRYASAEPYSSTPSLSPRVLVNPIASTSSRSLRPRGTNRTNTLGRSTVPQHDSSVTTVMELERNYHTLQTTRRGGGGGAGGGRVATWMESALREERSAEREAEEEPAAEQRIEVVAAPVAENRQITIDLGHDGQQSSFA